MDDKDLHVERRNIYISTFFSPGLFWFIYDTDIPKRSRIADQINNFLRPERLYESKIGQQIIVNYDSIWVRAELVKINIFDKPTKEYVCWLIDYGIFCLVNAVYALPEELVVLPTYIKKAKIYGLTSVINELNIETGKMKKSPNVNWAAGIRKNVSAFLLGTDVPQLFVWQCTHNGFEIGDLFCQDSKGEELNMAQKIMQWGLGDYDEQQFQIDCFSKLKNIRIPFTVIYTTITSSRIVYKSNSYPISKGRGIFRHPTSLTYNNEPLGCSTIMEENACATTESKTDHTINGSKGRGKFIKDLVNRVQPAIEHHHDSTKETILGFSKGPRPEPDFNDDQSKFEDFHDDFECSLNSSGRGFSKAVSDSDDSFEKTANGRGLSKIINRLKKFERTSRLKEDFEDVDFETSSSSKGRGFCKISPKHYSELNGFEEAKDEFETYSSKGRGFSKTSPHDLRKSELANVSLNFDDAEDFESFTSAGRGFFKTNLTQADDFETFSSTGRGSSKRSLKNASSIYKASPEKYNSEDALDNSPEKNSKTKSSSNSSIDQITPFIPKSSQYEDSRSILSSDSSHCEMVPFKCYPAGANLSSNKLNKIGDHRNEQQRFRDSKTSARKTSNSDSDRGSSDHNGNHERVRQSSSDSTKHNEHKYLNSNEKNSPNCTKKHLPNGRCDCKQCDEWMINNARVFQNREAPKIEKKPLPKKMRTAPTLLFKPTIIGATEVNAYGNLTTHIAKLTASRLLAHGTHSPSPHHDLCTLPFHVEVHASLQHLQYIKAYRVQTYAWPAILRDQNLIVVNVPNSGKTMVYVPAICSFVLQCPNELTLAMGPLVVIICPGVESAENVYKLIIKMINMKSKIGLIIPPQGKHQDKELAAGVDILICTPRTFRRVIKDKAINLRRLRHVVLENASELFDLFADDMDVIFAIFEKMLTKHNTQRDIQMIAVSQEWSSALERLAKRLVRIPLICIGSYLEATLYGRTDIQVKFTESSSKHSELLNLIQSRSLVYKTVIICNELAEIERLLEYLKKHYIRYLMLNEKSSVDDIKLVNAEWANIVSGKYPVLVCTDDILNTVLPIFDASVVIQNSLPISWSQFALRFSLFTDNYPSPLVQDIKEKFKRCKMYIFVDETNLEQFPRMVHLLQRMGCVLNKDILDKYSELLMKIEQEKVSNQIELCEKVKLFGICHLHITCKYRHILSVNVDRSTRLPNSGLVKLKVLHIRNVTSFYARLIEYTDAEEIVHQVEDNFAYIAVHMTKLANTKEKPIVVNVHIGSIAAVEEIHGIFRRCVVIRVQKHGTLNQPLLVTVRLLDTGAELVVATSNLYMISDRLKAIPPQAVEIYLANVGPPDRDSTWSQLCVSRVTTAFDHADYENVECYFIGRIKLQLGNAIWVDNLILKHYLENGSLIVNKLSVRYMLFNKKLVEDRPEHLEHLYALCKQYDFKLPNYNLPINKELKRQRKQQASWAHLDNLEDYNWVYMSAAQSPDHFYLQLAKNNDLLEQLSKEIQLTISKPLYTCVFDVFVGHYYLGKDPQENVYARVLVTKLESDLAHCFFVDYGDTELLPIIELKYLSDDLIAKLPFQIIECQLWGIAPANSESWLSEATDIFYDIAFEPESNTFRSLSVKVVTDSEPEVTGYKKYSVILFDTFKEIVNVNDLLVQKCFAIRTEKMIDIDFDQLIPKVPHLVDSDCENDEIEEIRRQSEESDDENNMDIQIFDAKAFFNGLFKKDLPTLVDNTNNAKSIDYPIAMAALPSPDYSTPNVVWSQTNLQIILHIKVTGVSEYNVNVLRNRILTFKTEIRNTNYRLDLNLFAKVSPQVEHSVLGLYVLVKLIKDTEMEWDRLVSNTERMRFITYNVSEINIDDDDSDVEPCLDKPKVTNDDDNEQFVYEYGSDVDYNESDYESELSSDG